MPEIIEIEYYRRLAEQRAVGRLVREVHTPDDWFLKEGTQPEALVGALTNRRITGARRRGKLMMLDVGDSVLGLRYGMTGRLLVDDHPAIARLEYSSDKNDPAWDRFLLTLSRAEGARSQGSMVIRDPRRLGGVVLDPDESALGPDAWNVTAEELSEVLGRSTAPLKARLMDQARLAGVGNLLADETLWQAGLSPVRPAKDLSGEEIDRLAATLREVIADLAERGGSHTGDVPRDGSPCPRTGAEMTRSTVGGRTTWWCSAHQI